jgi:NAD(P)-dependent dehydrogenase (short-subunit alcohol dehydrogenase family)
MPVAVVTNGGGDFGPAVIKRFQAEGMTLAVLGPEARGGDLALQLDLTDREQLMSAAERVSREQGAASSTRYRRLFRVRARSQRWTRPRRWSLGLQTAIHQGGQ